MRYFFQDTFVSTVKSLLKKKSYKDCEQAIIQNVFNCSKEELFLECTANRLNPNGENPMVKMRIAYKKSKRSSYRLYFFVIQRKEELYFGHLYPKTGSKGVESLSNKEQRTVVKTLVKDISEKSMLEVYYDKTKDKICYCKDQKLVWS